MKSPKKVLNKIYETSHKEFQVLNCTSVTLFVCVLHLNCIALSQQQELSNFFHANKLFLLSQIDLFFFFEEWQNINLLQGHKKKSS